MQFQLALDKTFCPNPQPLTHRRLKQRKETKINKNEHKFNKTDIEKWLTIEYNLGSSWLETRSHDRYTMFIR